MREEGNTYCFNGALCLPPSKFPGIIVYVELPAVFPPRGPRFRLLEPDVPASEEVVKPGSRAQHSSVEALFCALRTVTFNVLAAARAEVRMGTMVVRRMLAISLCSGVQPMSYRRVRIEV
jgi:hypothetical protein